MTTLDDPQMNLPDPNNVSARPISMRYGLMAGLATVVAGLLFQVLGMVDYTGQSSNIIPTLVTFAIYIAAFVMTVQYHRDKELGGYISFGRCVNIAFWLGLVVGVISMIWAWVNFTIIQPDILDTILEMTQDQMEEQGLSGEELDMAMKWTGTMMTPTAMAIMSFVSAMFFMMVIGLIGGAIMKREPQA